MRLRESESVRVSFEMKTKVVQHINQSIRGIGGQFEQEIKNLPASYGCMQCKKLLLHANNSRPTCRKSGWDPLYPAHQKGRSALSQHQGNTSQGIELWVTSSCARLGHIIVPPPCTMGSSAVVALGHSTYQTRPHAVRAVTHQIW